ncbi:MAG: hypothetical protein AUJ52_10340 [Elusimicrobia bacterium CG1_02_63_36]|nr:MAG: hypothetical protein AUJ52_10340 [Elusimicrobia bacterium CG1_02_63_36]
MSFLNPALLWWLPAAAAPIVLHLIFMRRARRVEFSDLSLLRAAYARSLPATRLRHWLLLALRCLMLALLILAFARPVLHRRASAAAGSEKGLELIVLVDVSWSMRAGVRGKPRFETARAAAVELVGTLKPPDRVALASFSDRLESPLAWSDSPEAARASLSRLQPGFRGTDAGSALAAAYALFAEDDAKAPERRRVIVVVTDGARNAFSSLSVKGLEALPGYDSEVTVLGMGLEGSAPNSAVLDARPGAAGAEDRVALSVRTAAYGEDARAGSLDLWVRDRRVDQRAASPDPERPALFRLPESRDADHWGRFSLREDALALDDDYYFALRMRPRPKVLLVYGNSRYLEAGRGGYFLKKLLSDGKRLPFFLDAVDFGKFARIDPFAYGAVLLADFESLPEGVAETLERYVLRGGGLWLLAGTQADAKTYRDLKRVLPAEVGDPRQVGPRGRALRADAVPTDEAVLPARFSWDDFELQNAAAERAYTLRPRKDAAVWFRDGEGEPLMVAGGFGLGRVLVWGSSLDIEWSNLALKPVFTAWTDVALRWLSRYSGREQWRTVSIGEPIERNWDGGEQAPVKVQIRAPGGRRSSLLVKDRKIVFSDTREPGLYFLQPVGGEGDSPTEAFAVNADRSSGESDLSPAPRMPFHALLNAGSVREDFLRAVYGRETRTAALGLVMLLALLEAALARPRRRGA